MTYYGNLEPGVVMIDSKPVPGSDKVISVFSPGHGQKEHAGPLAIVDPKAGPDDEASVRMITKAQDYRDPWAFSEQCILAARGSSLVLLDGAGNEEIILDSIRRRAQGRSLVPRTAAACARPRETAVVDRTDPAGRRPARMVLMDARLGRNMEGVGKDEIKELLVLESLPKPINFTGGMEPLSYGGTFTLERVLGTVPVEAGWLGAFRSAGHAQRVFRRARRQRPRGETHAEFHRRAAGRDARVASAATNTGAARRRRPAARLRSPLRRPPDVIKPYPDMPDVFDFPRDIQPILDRHCVKCHHTDQRRWRRDPHRRPRADVFAQLLLAHGDRPVRRRPQPRRRATTRRTRSAAVPRPC